MKQNYPLLFSLCCLMLSFIFSSKSYAQAVYNESDGMVIMEMENTASNLDLWVEKTDIANYTGSNYLEFTGNAFDLGPPVSPLEYNFRINKAGYYYLVLRCAKETIDGRTDVANDAYVRVDGDYGPGPNPGNAHLMDAPLSLLQSDTKFFGGSHMNWEWATGARLDPGGHNNKRYAIYDFKEGETYKLVIHGRSKFFKVDRIIFRHIDTPTSVAHDASLPESAHIGGTVAYSYSAITDFPNLNAGEVPYYVDSDRSALAINAANESYRDKFARAARAFYGTSGTYSVRITTLTEEDGECLYRLLINGSVVGTFLNPYIGAGSPLDSQPTTYTWSNINIQAGDEIAIESNTHTNGEIPEGAGTAWARGRWQKIDLLSDASANTSIENTSSAGVYGETDEAGNQKKWHKVTVAFQGPYTNENADPNPFTDYRLNVTFTHPGSGKSYVIPGYYAADGFAGESGANSGNIWRAHFAPDEIGSWNYSASFHTGRNVAIYLDPAAGMPTAFNGASGSFNVVASDKAGRDMRAKGRLLYDGTRYLKHGETGEAFIKVGADAPENFLSYGEFDNTYTQSFANTSYIKNWAPHVQDWRAGDPTWKGGKGKGIIGAINYLASEGQNVFSFLTYNAGGDSKDIWPFVVDTDPLRYDCSKLDQWEVVFAHGTHMGMYLHFKTQETENDQHAVWGLDQGETGLERKLYYRELVARFAHHLALNWNLGEENTQSDAQRIAMSEYFDDIDPYNHNQVLHTYPGQQDMRYGPMLGNNSRLSGVSIQTDWANVHQETLKWINDSAAAGRQWVVANDEQGSANAANPPDDGYTGPNGTDTPYVNATTPSQTQMRGEVVWGNLMAGGAGIELYAGYQLPQSDLTLQDFRSRDRMWDYNRNAYDFFTEYLPFDEMSNRNDLIGNAANANNKYCFAKPGDIYAIYLRDGGSTNLDLGTSSATYTISWYNPRDGGAFVAGSKATITGPGSHSIGNAPSGGDWVVSVRRQGYTAGLNNNAADFVSTDMPSTILPGTTKYVSVTMRNTGPEAWSAAGGYSLRSLNSHWGITEAALPHNVPIGSEVTFVLPATVPTVEGDYSFEWQMFDAVQNADEKVGSFGEAVNLTITVGEAFAYHVINPSFEIDDNSDGMPDDWTLAAAYSRTAEDASEGSYSVKVSGSGALGSIRQTIALEPDTIYNLSVRLKFLSGGTGNLVFDTWDKFDDQGAQFVLNSPNGAWTRYSAQFNSGTETSVILRAFTNATFSGTAYIDEVILTSQVETGPVNEAPQITSNPGLNAEAGVQYIYTVTASDAEGDAIALTAVSIPSWLSFNGSVLSGTPSANDLGSNSVTLRSGDADSFSDQRFTINVSLSGNDTPMITSIPGEGVVEGNLYTYEIIAVDYDGDTLEYSASVLPSWLNISANMISGTPTAADIGLHPVSISVADGTDTVTQDFNIMVFELIGSSGAPNLILNGSFENGGAAPTSWTLGNNAVGSSEQSSDGSSSLKLSDGATVSFQDVPLTPYAEYRLSVWVLAPGVTSGAVHFDTNDVFDSPTGPNGPGGNCQFSIQVGEAPVWTEYTGTFNSDSLSTVRLRAFAPTMVGTAYFDNITLVDASWSEETNTAPAFTSTAVTDAVEGFLYSYAVSAVDVDSQDLTLTAVAAPSWLNFDAGTAVLSGTPGAGDVGSHPVTIRVSDGEYSTDQSFIITVTAPANDYDGWKATYGITDDNADDDKDGLSNILEFALGGDPGSAASGQLPVVSKNGNNVDFSFQRAEVSVTYIVEKSTDLVSWSVHAVADDSHGAVGGNCTVSVPDTDLVLGGKLFLRLKVNN